MKGDKQLSERERVAVPDFSAVIVVTKLIGTQRTKVGQMFPYLVFQLCCSLTAHVAVDLKEINRTPAVSTKYEPNAGESFGRSNR